VKVALLFKTFTGSVQARFSLWLVCALASVLPNSFKILYSNSRYCDCVPVPDDTTSFFLLPAPNNLLP